MEILNPFFSTQTPQIIFTSSSLLSTKNSIKIYRNKNSPNFKPQFFNFSLKTPPIFSNFTLYASRDRTVSAHFNRPTKRKKNHLRKKLIEQQVRRNPQNPIRKIDDSNDSLSNSGNFDNGSDCSVSSSTEGLKLSDNVMWNQLESWANQYKADSEFWGVGSNPIFTVFQNFNGKVEKVDVDEDEILRRNHIDPSIYNPKEIRNVKELQDKISHAKFLAKEMEIGKNVIPSNSSVAKFVIGKSGFRDTIQTFTRKPGFAPKLSKVGISVVCGFFVFLVLKSFLRNGKGDKKELSSLEKEMMRRKIKARMAKEKSAKGSVEVIQDSKDPEMVFTVRPQVDKEELMNSIAKVKTLSDNSMNFDDKIEEIRAMARHAREIEREIEKTDGNSSDEEDDERINDEPKEKEVNHMEPTSFDAPQGDVSRNLGELSSADMGNIGNSDVQDSNGSLEVVKDSKDPEMVFRVRPQVDKEELMNTIAKVKTLSDNSMHFDAKIEENGAIASHTLEIEKTDGSSSNGEDDERINNEPKEKEVNHMKPTSFDVLQGDISRNLCGLSSADKGNIGNSDVLTLGVPNNDESVAGGADAEKLVEKKTDRPKSRIISSVKEAREYLHKKKVVEKDKNQETEATNIKEVPKVPKMATNGKTFDVSSNGAPSGNTSSIDTKLGEKENVSMKNISSKYKNKEHIKGSDEKAVELGRTKREKWMEDNFHEFEPIVEKIKVGFRNNYNAAREKVKEDVNMISELKMMLERDENKSEFEWMKDEKLREIVFQVRENELMGRDPFYLMDSEDKALFFKGLEKKVEKENEELRQLHEYIHSNIENLDYGADGISLYDPPEKIIPQWKGPPPSTKVSQEFLDDYYDQRKALFAEILGNSSLVKRDPQNSVQSTDEKAEVKNLKSSKTVIEGSDGSVKPGKKSGKEFWQHTKKWSRGFIDSYNAENDPETKAIMKDIGKDLDRWITEKEIQDVADIMNKVPEKGKKFIEEKISKLKREMELFGPQAVVSKYSEYGEEEEIDYYWWLDLPYVLCIELYIDGDGEQRIGFYSLEMASDLELDPKPHHIIAFEDAGDCKNLCYIINAHMEMLGNGNAFVVPQLPKDAYREAKENGFNVTVIRKGELKLDVDQTLEEVEEKIDEIGSKMYHDKIMKDRNVNVDAVMKGVFGLKKPTKRRRSKKKLKPTK